MEIETAKLSHCWVLWYHDPENKDYSIRGYSKIADVQTPQQFWSIVEAIPQNAWESGMFFFMKHGVLPIWEDAQNENGGTWSKKIEASTTYDTFIELMVHCLAEELLLSRKDTLVGVTVSPKGPFSIIKIWNNTTTIFKNSVINPQIECFKIADDVVYTPHKTRPK